MSDESIQRFPYTELDDKLKEKIRNHLRSNEEFVPYNWYEEELDLLLEKYSGQVEIDRNSIQFDMYRNDFSLEGVVDLKHSANRKFIPQKFYEYHDKEWIYDIENSFKDGEMMQDFSVDINMIYVDIEDSLFGKQKKNMNFDDGTEEIDISICAPKLKSNIVAFSKGDGYVSSVLDKWMGQIEAAELFFQDTIIITEDDCKGVIDSLGYNLQTEVEDFMSGEFYDSLNEFVENLFEEFIRKIKDSYDYYYSDEYVDHYFADIEFDVLVDVDGNQLDVEDLNGV